MYILFYELDHNFTFNININKSLNVKDNLILFYLICSIKTSLTGHIELHFRGVFAMDIANNDFVFAFIIGFHFSHAKCY